MKLRYLYYFVVVADALNFSRAAEALYVSQPSLSQQIAELEKELGVKLFTRTNRAVSLTAEGEALLRDARDILLLVDNLKNSVSGASHAVSEKGELRIGYEPNFQWNNAYFRAVEDACLALRNAYPTYSLKFFPITDNGSVKNRRVTDDIDVAVISRSHLPDDPRFLHKVIGEEDIVLTLRSDKTYSDNIGSIREVFSCRDLFLHSEMISGIAQSLNIIYALDVMPNIKFESSFHQIRTIVASGDGCTMIPEPGLHLYDVSDMQILHFSIPESKLYTMLVWKKDAENPALGAFLNLFEAAAQ